MIPIRIAPAVTAANAVIVLHRSDNVAIARAALSPGQPVEVSSHAVTVRGPIAPGHKIAIRTIEEASPVVRYGETIGLARVRIEAGEHVHTHNLLFQEHDELAVITADLPPQPGPGRRTFDGFVRDDGRVGTRNYIAIVAASNCAAHTASLIEKRFLTAELPPGVDGVVSFPHGDGCGQALGPDTDQLRRTLEGVLHHPNVAAAIVLGLGCEVNQIDHYLGPSNGIRPKTLTGLTLQASGGTRQTVDKAAIEIDQLLDLAAACHRAASPVAALTLGLNCGGSDSFSGITANPALGYCCDLLVEEGAAVVLAETTEIFGAEHLLSRRARTPDIAAKLNGTVAGYKGYLARFAGSFDDNPSPGNKQGGLTNIVEKSLGAVAKAGSSPLEDVVDYAERIKQRGLTFMNTPGYDPASLAGLAAGGVNLIAFTTGRGSAIGFATVPVFKISSNTPTFDRMMDNIDLNAGTILDGEQTVESAGQAIFDCLLRVASGEKTKAERLGHHEFVPWRIGPVL